MHVHRRTERGLRDLRWNTVSIVFQGAMNALDPVMRVSDQIGEAIRLHEPGDRRRRPSTARIAELFGYVGISPGRARQYPHEFSGGMRQRVMIALALACNPELIIGDEPTTALDVMMQAQILELLEQLRRDFGLSMILITHDLSVLAETCDRVAIMYGGQIAETGPGRASSTRRRSTRTRAAAGRVPDDRRPARAGAGDPRRAARPGRRCPRAAGSRRAATARRGRVRARAGVRDAGAGRRRATARCLFAPWPERRSAAVSVEHGHATRRCSRSASSRCTSRSAAPGERVRAGAGRRRPEWHRGEVLGIVGESGCGKSTLGRALLGLAAADRRRGAVRGRAARDGRTCASCGGGSRWCSRIPYQSLNPRMTRRRARAGAAADPRHRQARRRARRRWRSPRSRAPGCARRRATGSGIRTSCRAASASAS